MAENGSEMVTENPEMPVQMEAEPVQLEADPVQMKAEPVQLEAEPVQLEAEPVQLEAEPVQAEPVQEEIMENTELQKYWKAVRDNPSDFTGWTYLLQYVEQEDNIDHAREAFDAFLTRYPYCYGYWKKFADLEKKHEHDDKVEEVYIKGLSAIPLSIDLWVHHIQVVEERFENQPNKEEMVRSMYEKAITAAGTDFRSDKLWEMYITWEREAGNLKNVTALYDRILVIPTQMYKHHFDQFQEHVKQNMPKDILPLDDFLKLRQEVVVKNPVAQPVLPGDGDEDADADEQPAAIDEAPPGEEAPPGVGGEDATIDIDKETSDLRDKIIESRQEVHQLNEQEVSKRWAFEEAIRRPYFHVKPLEKGQVKNWREYLEFELENGTHERVLVLFERCLIACAMYEEFWVKYAKYLEPHSADGARNVYTRACTIHLARKATLHIAWAAFEERQGEMETALKIITNLEVTVTGLVMVSLKKISLNRRMGKSEEVEELYKKYIEDGDASVASFYSIRYSRYLAKILHNREKAKTILKEALEKDEKNHKLYLQLVDLEYQKEEMNENDVLEAIDLGLKSNIALEHRVALSRRRQEFLEDFGSQVTSSVDSYSEHQALVKELQLSKKRKTTDTGSANPEKKQKIDNSYTAQTQYNTNGTGDQSQKHYNQNHNTGQEDYSAYGYGGWGNYQNYNYQQPAWGNYNSGYYGQQ